MALQERRIPLQERRIPHVETYNFGVGIDGLSGTAMNQVVEPIDVPPDKAGGGGELFEVSRVSSTHDLQESLGIDANASYGCAAFGAGISARFSFAQSSNVHSGSLFMAITVTVKFADLSIAHCVLTHEAAAVADNLDTFKARYGDMFLRACRRGGIFVGMMHVETFDDAEATKIEAELRGSYGLFSADVSTKFSKITQDHKVSVYCRVYTEGGPAIEIADPNDPVLMLQAANAWLKAMYDAPDKYGQPYEWTVSPISIAEGPVLNAEDIEHAQDVLKFCVDERATMLDQLNLLNWWREHPDRYDWTGGTTVDQVVAAVKATESDLNVIAHCASSAMDNPKTALFPDDYAKSVGKGYPSGQLPPVQPKPLIVVTAPADISSLAAFTPDAVLLAGGWRDATGLATMSAEDKRNTLIWELSSLTRIPEANFFQGFQTDALVAKGAILIFLMKAGIRTVPALRTMTVDDQRNTLIVENAGHTASSVKELQGMSDRELVQVGLSWFAP